MSLTFNCDIREHCLLNYIKKYITKNPMLNFVVKTYIIFKSSCLKGHVNFKCQKLEKNLKLIISKVIRHSGEKI